VTTNDIVINKLTQILSYLRHGKRDKKNKKKLVKSEEIFDSGAKNSRTVDATNDLSIYDDIGDYVPTLSKSDATKKKEAEDRKRNYFGTSKEVTTSTFLFFNHPIGNQYIGSLNQNLIESCEHNPQVLLLTNSQYHSKDHRTFRPKVHPKSIYLHQLIMSHL